MLKLHAEKAIEEEDAGASKSYAEVYSMHVCNHQSNVGCISF